MKRLIAIFSCAALAALAACAAQPAAEVVSAREIGFVNQSAAIQGRDGGGSALLWGRAIFSYGDTVLNRSDEQGQTWHHNSFSFTSDRRGDDGIGPLEERTDRAGAPSYLLAPTADEAAFNEAHRGDPCKTPPCGARFAVWPGTPVWDAAGQRALILYGLIYAEPGPFNFHGVGQSIAVWRRFEDAPERLLVTKGAPHPTLLFGEGEAAPTTAPVIVNRGAAPLTADADRLFAFECREGLERPCVLHSAPLSQVLERAAWRVWDGAGWSTDLSRAQTLFGGSPIMNVSYNDYLAAWQVVYSAPLSNDVLLRTSPALTGPWSAPLRLFVADHGKGEGPVYDALDHPAFAEGGGRVLYITHSRPTGETWFSARFPLHRVELRAPAGG